jgi:hypothetical protein
MYEKTVAACAQHESSQWNIGDALLEECEPDSFNNLVAVLAERGLEYSPRYLRIMREVAHIFPPDVRTTSVAWSVYREYLTHSEVLIKWIVNHPGETMTVAKAKEHVSWLIHGDGDLAPEAPAAAPAEVEDIQYVPDAVEPATSPRAPSRDTMAFDILKRRAEDALEETWSVATDLIEHIKNHEDDLSENWKAAITKLAEDSRDKLSELLRFTRPKSGKKIPAFTVVSSEARI